MPLSEFTEEAQKTLNETLSGIASTHDRLRSWALNHMPDIGNQMLVGSIIWAKNLGRPTAERLCDGFDISLPFGQETGIGTPGDGGPVEITIHGSLPVDKKWDDGDEQNYIVHFIHVMPSAKQLSVAVALVAGVAWQDSTGAPSTEHLIVSPSKRDYGYDPAHPTIPNWIEPFRVIRIQDYRGVYRTS